MPPRPARSRRAGVERRASRVVGIGESEDVDAYLDGVARSIMRDPTGNDGSPTYDVIEGDAPTTPPGSEDFWHASAQGRGQQTATLTPEEGGGGVVLWASLRRTRETRL